MNAINCQSNYTAVEILKNFGNSNELFLTKEDMFKLIDYESTYVSSAFDKIFVDTKFERELSQIDQFGKINH